MRSHRDARRAASSPLDTTPPTCCRASPNTSASLRPSWTAAAPLAARVRGPTAPKRLRRLRHSTRGRPVEGVDLEQAGGSIVDMALGKRDMEAGLPAS